jgi:hypothetical protein
VSKQREIAEKSGTAVSVDTSNKAAVLSAASVQAAGITNGVVAGSVLKGSGLKQEELLLRSAKAQELALNSFQKSMSEKDWKDFAIKFNNQDKETMALVAEETKKNVERSYTYQQRAYGAIQESAVKNNERAALLSGDQDVVARYANMLEQRGVVGKGQGAAVVNSFVANNTENTDTASRSQALAINALQRLTKDTRDDSFWTSGAGSALGFMTSLKKGAGGLNPDSKMTEYAQALKKSVESVVDGGFKDEASVQYAYSQTVEAKVGKEQSDRLLAQLSKSRQTSDTWQRQVTGSVTDSRADSSSAVTTYDLNSATASFNNKDFASRIKAQADELRRKDPNGFAQAYERAINDTLKEATFIGDAGSGGGLAVRDHVASMIAVSSMAGGPMNPHKAIYLMGNAPTSFSTADMKRFQKLAADNGIAPPSGPQDVDKMITQAIKNSGKEGIVMNKADLEGYLGRVRDTSVQVSEVKYSATIAGEKAADKVRVVMGGGPAVSGRQNASGINMGQQ